MSYTNAQTSSMIRFCVWLLICWGVYLLFSPVIALFKFIPLIGYFLATTISFAAVIFAVIFGSIIHLSTLSIAWLFHRPLFGLTLLAGIALLFSLLFINGQGGAATGAAMAATAAK